MAGAPLARQPDHPGRPALPAAVLWDLDGTLVDTEPSWMAAERRLARRHGARWTDADGLALVGGALLDSGRYIRRRMALDLTPEEVVDELVAAVADDVRRHVPWRPGAPQLLASLRKLGVPCALVTMSYAQVVGPVLDQLPAQTFDAVVTGDTVERGKPHPEPYLEALRLLDVPARRCVALEDSPAGTASARAAGLHVLVVPHVAPVDGGPGRTVVDSLASVRPADLAALVTDS